MTENPAEPFRADLEQARQGDRQSLDRILQRLAPRFRRDATRQLGARLRSRTRASDLLQDAYLEVVGHIDDFAGQTESEFFAWVTSIIDSCARQQHRYLTAQKRKPPSRTSELNALAAAYLQSGNSPASTLVQAERVALVYKALGSLRKDYRVVIEQAVLAQRPVEEVAEGLGRSESATRMLLSRARTALTLRLDELKRREASLEES